MSAWKVGTLAVLGAVGLMNPASAAPVLTGGVLFNATAAGAYDASGVRWNTLGGDNLFNLYFRNAVTNTWANSGNTVGSTALNVTMNPGSYIFNIFGEPGVVPAQGSVGLNLFFDGLTAPSISTRNAINGLGLPVANGSASTLQVDGNTLVPGANTLTFTQGGMIVTLSAFSWSSPTSNPNFGNVVSSFNNVPSTNGSVDFWGAVRLDVQAVTAIPEPGTWSLMLCAGLLGALLVRRR